MNNHGENEFSRDTFMNPGKEFAVAFAWVWNVPITKDGIDERLNNYAKAGIRSVYILPEPIDFRPERIRTFMNPEYLTEEYFELVKYALEKARELGMEPWIYDEGGWPSGGACGNTFRQNPEAPMRILEARRVHISRDIRFVPDENFVALFDGKRRLPDDYISARNFDATAYYAVPTVYDGNRADCTNASVTDTFIHNTYEAYKNALGNMFGSSVKLIFTDEPGMQPCALAHNEIELFMKEYGYDIRDYIYVISDASLAVSEEEIRARIDHFELMGKLFRQNTCERLEKWCEENGVYYGGHLDLDNRPFGGVNVGYFSHTDLLRHMHIPGVDVIWEQIRYPYGGRAPVDDETLEYGFFPRLAPSAARQTGKRLALTESFGVYGDALTPDEIRYVANYQAIRGINVFNFMTLPYGTARCAALMERPCFIPEKPGFYNLKHINEYYARLSYLLRLGDAEGDTALYHPCRDYAGSAEDLDLANVSFKTLGSLLEEKNISFDIIDDNAIRDSLDTGDGLKIGDALYRHIAVPTCRRMPDDVKKKIEKYIGIGDPIYAPKSQKLRFMTRKVGKSRLWFVFNEGIDKVSEVLNIASNEKIYSFDLACGKMYSADKANVDLNCGDMAVFLVTNEEYSTDRESDGKLYEISDFKIKGYDRTVIDHVKVSSVHYEGEPVIDEDFSGTVIYSANYDLPFIPSDDEQYYISLDGFSVSAEVRLDGKYACDLGMTPMKAVLPKGMLKKNGVIEIAVSNTAANEILAKTNVISSFPAAEIGPYASGEYGHMYEFESRRPPLKFGKVFISK